VGHVLDDWFQDVITSSWILLTNSWRLSSVPGGYNLFLEVITGSWRLKPVSVGYNRFLEVLTGSWRL